jgi:hypothetical protein
VKFTVLTAVKMSIMVFWVVMPRGLGETGCFTETLVSVRVHTASQPRTTSTSPLTFIGNITNTFYVKGAHSPPLPPNRNSTAVLKIAIKSSQSYVCAWPRVGNVFSETVCVCVWGGGGVCTSVASGLFGSSSSHVTIVLASVTLVRTCSTRSMWLWLRDVTWKQKHKQEILFRKRL